MKPQCRHLDRQLSRLRPGNTDWIDRHFAQIKPLCCCDQANGIRQDACGQARDQLLDLSPHRQKYSILQTFNSFGAHEASKKSICAACKLIKPCRTMSRASVLDAPTALHKLRARTCTYEAQHPNPRNPRPQDISMGRKASQESLPGFPALNRTRFLLVLIIHCLGLQQ